MNDFIRIQANQLLLEGFFGFWPIVKEEVNYILSEINPEDDLTVFLDSGGGDPDTAIAIRRAIAAHPGRTTLYIQGNCMSAATLLPGGFDEVITDPFSVWLFHNPKIDPDWVDDDEAAAMAQWIRIKKEQMIALYQEDSGQDADTLKAWMKETKVISGTEAVEFGFADRTGVYGQLMVEAPADDMRVAASAYGVPKEDLDGRTSPRQQATNQKDTPIMQPSWMSKIKAALGMGDDKDEADAVLSIKELKAKADKTDTMQSTIDDLKTKNTELQEKLDAIEAKQTADAEEAETAEQTERENAVQAAIDGYKIKASDKDAWIDDFADLPVGKLKATLDRIPEGATKPGGDIKNPKNGAVRAAVGLNDQIAKDLGLN